MKTHIILCKEEKNIDHKELSPTNGLIVRDIIEIQNEISRLIKDQEWNYEVFKSINNQEGRSKIEFNSRCNEERIKALRWVIKNFQA